MSSSVDQLDVLLERSQELEICLSGILNDRNQNEVKRRHVSRVLCSLSREHGQSCRILIAHLNLTSALGLIRLQYESLVRALWVGYVAKEKFINEIAADLTIDTIHKNSQTPTLTKMLEELEKGAKQGIAPLQPLQELKELKEHGWRPLNSLVHSGNHAYNRHKNGYPTQYVTQSLRISNGFFMITAYMMAVLSDDEHYMKNLKKYQIAFTDCLPLKERFKGAALFKYTLLP